MQLSRGLAIVLGILTPCAETIRRWSTWQENPPALFEHYCLGALLPSGSWLVGRGFHGGQCLLAAAWGFFCGLAYASFFGQLYRLQQGDLYDPAPIPSSWVVVIKGVGFAIGIMALTITLRTKPPKRRMKDEG